MTPNQLALHTQSLEDVILELERCENPLAEHAFSFGPSRAIPELNAHATLKLLQNITNPFYNERGAVLHMNSPTLNCLRTARESWSSDGQLSQSAFQMTIVPASEVFDLEYREHFLISTLLTGCQVWIVYPPLHSNPDHLQQQYKKLAGPNPQTKSGASFLALKSVLRHGIVLVQKPGQVLMLPPFWIHTTFCIETSVHASYMIATALKDVERLAYTDLFVAVMRPWPNKEKEQAELIKHATSLAHHLQTVLNGKFSHFKPTSVIQELCKEWDTRVQDNSPLRDKVNALCAAIEDDEERRKIEDVFQAAWMAFLEGKRRKNPACRLCGMRVDKMPGNDKASRRLEMHFLWQHWVEADVRDEAMRTGQDAADVEEEGGEQTRG